MTTTESFQNVCRSFVQNHVIHCANTLIYELSQRQEALAYDDREILWNLSTAKDYETAGGDKGWEFAESFWVFEGDKVIFLSKDDVILEGEAWLKLCEMEAIDPADHYSAKDAAEDEGWSLLEDVTFVNTETKETSEAENWEELFDEQDIEPYEREVYEHWVVDSFLARKLIEKGEVVADFLDFTIWGRCTTGQSIYLDGVIEAIVSEVEAASYQ